MISVAYANTIPTYYIYPAEKYQPAAISGATVTHKTIAMF